MPNAGMPNTVTGMPNVRGITRNAKQRNAESMWCYGLYGEKFRLHVQAHMVLALILAKEPLHKLTSYDDNVTVVGFHYQYT